MTPPTVVLAAGKSTRIASVTQGRPKPLLTIAGKSVIEHTLEWLASSGVHDVWINLHHRPDEIRDALGDGSAHDVRLHYSHEEIILGTAGGWKNIAREWKHSSLVVYGDNLMRFDLARLLSAHRASRRIATVALFDPRRHTNTRIAGGLVQMDASNRVVAFVEGGTGDGTSYVNAGAYVLEPEVLTFVGEGIQDFARDVFPALVATDQLGGYVFEDDGYCLGLDTPASLACAEELIATRQVLVS